MRLPTGPGPGRPQACQRGLDAIGRSGTRSKILKHGEHYRSISAETMRYLEQLREDFIPGLQIGGGGRLIAEHYIRG
jgi:hypothetical protein